MGSDTRLDHALWEEALSTVPDKEIVNLVNNLKLPVDGFKIPTSIRVVSRARHLLEPKLKAHTMVRVIENRLKQMMEKSEELSGIITSPLDDLSASFQSGKGYLSLWCLLSDGSAESLAKARELLRRMKDAPPEEGSGQGSMDEPAPESKTRRRDTSAASGKAVAELEQENARLKSAVDELEQKNARLESALKRMKREAEQKRASWDEQMAALRKENQALQRQLRAASQQVKKLEDLIQQRDQEVARLSEELDQARATTGKLTQELREKARVMEELQQALATASMAAPTAEAKPGSGREDDMAGVGPRVLVFGISDARQLQASGLRVKAVSGSDVAHVLDELAVAAWDQVYVNRSSVPTRWVHSIPSRFSAPVRVCENIAEIRRHLASITGGGL